MIQLLNYFNIGKYITRIVMDICGEYNFSQSNTDHKRIVYKKLEMQLHLLLS